MLVAGYPIDQLRSSARVLLDHPGTRALFLVEREAEIVGFVAVDWDQTQPDLAIIAFIEIAVSLQDKRYGREVLDAVMRWAGERGARRLVAEIPPENERSKRLFMRAGFRRGPVSSTRPGAVQRWVWPPDLATEAAQRRGRLQLVMSSPVDHDDVLRDIAPFYKSFDDQRSSPGRPTTHALLRLVEAVEADREAIAEGRATQNLPELVELRHVASTFKAWSRDERGAKVVRDISDPITYEDNVLVLSAHRLLHTWGNDDVRLVLAQQGRASATLRSALPGKSSGPSSRRLMRCAGGVTSLLAKRTRSRSGWFGDRGRSANVRRPSSCWSAAFRCRRRRSCSSRPRSRKSWSGAARARTSSGQWR